MTSANARAVRSRLAPRAAARDAFKIRRAQSILTANPPPVARAVPRKPSRQEKKYGACAVARATSGNRPRASPETLNLRARARAAALTPVLDDPAYCSPSRAEAIRSRRKLENNPIPLPLPPKNAAKKTPDNPASRPLIPPLFYFVAKICTPGLRSSMYTGSRVPPGETALCCPARGH